MRAPHSLHLLLHAPRRLWLRRAVFQVHLWAGVAIGLYTVIIGLTGSALVFRQEIDQALNPELRYVPAAGTNELVRADLDAVIAEVARQNPGFAVRGLQNLESGGDEAMAPAVFLEGESLPGPTSSRTSPERMVSFDPETGRILGRRDRFGGYLGWCANLHYYLLAGSRGYRINGILAACFAVLSVTGWLLWWPGAHSVLRALRIHWHARWPRLNWDLHAVGGFWINPALFLVVLTGVFFVFPGPFLGGLAIVSGGSLAHARAYLSAPTTPGPSGPPITVQRAYLTAHRMMPPDAYISYLSVAAGPAGSYDAIAYRRHGAPYSLPIHVYLDQYRGTVLAIHDARNLPWGLRFATYIYTVHFGSFAGWLSKMVWFLLGLTPAALLVTGLLMWWRRSLRRSFPRLARTGRSTS